MSARAPLTRAEMSRLDALRKLMKAAGGPAELSRRGGYRQPSAFSQWAGPSPQRPFSEKAARILERRLGVEEGMLDHPDNVPDNYYALGGSRVVHGRGGTVVSAGRSSAMMATLEAKLDEAEGATPLTEVIATVHRLARDLPSDKFASLTMLALSYRGNDLEAHVSSMLALAQ